jgi:multiple sugar transport system permease protein
MEAQQNVGDQVQPDITAPVSQRLQVRSSRAERIAQAVFLWPAVLVILSLSIFPLIISAYLSLSRFQIVKGGFEIRFIGWLNYRKLLFGSEQSHFLGQLRTPTVIGWTVLALVAGALLYRLGRYLLARNVSAGGLIGRLVGVATAIGLTLLLVRVFAPGGRPGTTAVTLIYVVVGIFFQYSLGLGLALLSAQQLHGRRFFRIVFLLPMMITPVGIAYMFRMLTDTNKGPLKPIWEALGMGGFSWVSDPWGARAAVLIGDIWQWTPFMFIVLLAALEGQAVEPVEAALVDGASRRQIFRYITLPAILPVSTTMILIRMIEAFKIVDLPNILTGGGPGTATESLTLHSFIAWRTQDLGGSAAVAFLLLILVTIVGTAFVNLVRRPTTEVA